jgi:hypothetical protein
LPTPLFPFWFEELFPFWFEELFPFWFEELSAASPSLEG